MSTLSDSDLPRNFALDTTGDLDLSTGNLQILGGLSSITQDVRLTLKSFKGEWFLDRDAGIPYFQDVLVKTPDPNVLQSIFRRALLARPGVTSVDELVFTRDAATRQLNVSVRLGTDSGDLVLRTAL